MFRDHVSSVVPDDSARPVPPIALAGRCGIDPAPLPLPPDGAVLGIVGASPAVEAMRRLVRRAAAVDATVLVEGPSGSGKELVARALHDAGPRRQQRFIAVNCGALTESLLESRLFGHRRGAFTSATSDAKGLFQLAHRGTLFLDEIGEASPSFQVHLLRALEERQIQPVGDGPSVPVDVRVVAATNRELEREATQGRFREDLLFRLRVFPIHVPPLAERREDIPLLVEHFLARYARDLQRPLPTVSPEAVAELTARSYPGTVRELANLLLRAMLLADPGEPIRLVHVGSSSVPTESVREDHPERAPLSEMLRTVEQRYIEQALERNGGNRSRTAQELGISVRWLLKKLDRYPSHRRLVVSTHSRSS